MSVSLELGIAQDVGFVASDSPCSRESQLHGGWSCFRARGDQYHGTPVGGRISSGPALATTRLLLGAELSWDRLALGARASWSFRGLGPPSDGSRSILSFGGEIFARLTVASTDAVRLDLLGLFGLRILDARVTEKIGEDRSVPPPVYQLDNPDRQTLDAYKRMGTGFIGFGLATTFAISKATAIRIELPLSIFFPSSGVALSPTALLVVTP